MSRHPIQALWIGSRLSTLGRLTIESFLAHGYDFHLYGYQEIGNTPAGTCHCNAREIYPEHEVFVYKRGAGKGSPSAFSNMFRYRLLELKGGWWSDLDVVCLQPLEFEAEHVLGTERRPKGSIGMSNALMRVPAASPLMRRCREVAEEADRASIRWGQIGPQLVTRVLEEVKPQIAESLELLPAEYFSPVDYWDIERLTTDQQIPREAYAMHMFHEMWRRKQLNPDRVYNEDCIYEQLVRRYLGDHERPSTRSTWVSKLWKRGQAAA